MKRKWVRGRYVERAKQCITITTIKNGKRKLIFKGRTEELLALDKL